MRKETRLLFALMFLLALAATGCRDSENAENEIIGTWQRNVASDTGTFAGLLTFGRDGSFAFTFVGNAVGHERTEGRFNISGRDIKFEDSSCGGVGRYRFLVKGPSLSFIPLADGCGKRKAMLTGMWRKKETTETETN